MRSAFGPSHRAYMLREHVVVPVLINVVINGGIVAALFRGQGAIPFEGGAVWDFSVIAFMVAFMSTLIVTRVVARQVRKGEVAPLPVSAIPDDGITTRPTWQRALALGGAALAFLGLPAIGLALGFGPETISYGGLVLAKAGFGGVVALLTGPFVGFWGLVAASRPVAAADPASLPI